MKLDPTVMRTMNRQDFRVLEAVETGMRNHALVPAKLIASIANLRHGGTGKILSSLLRDKLLSHDRSCGYDGYRLTNSGYDILALHNLKSRGLISALGDRIGTGKESDVYVGANAEGTQVVLKFHRLGRTSFRDVKNKRDYFMVNSMPKHQKGGNAFREQPNSWLFLSRISALKEFAFMKSLHQVQYPTPTPIGHNRHIVVMGLVRGVPLYQIHANRVSPAQAGSIFQQSATLATRLAKHGLVHCDLNEFNLMVDLSGIQNSISDHSNVGEHYVRHSGMSVVTRGALSAHGPLQKHHHMDGTGEFVTEAPPEPVELLDNGEPKPTVTIIDFPQMVSTRHPNAQELYERDIGCLKRYFTKKLKCVPEHGWDDWIPQWQDYVRDDDALASKAQIRLDEELKASGFSQEDSSRDMELYYYDRNQNAASALDVLESDESGDINENGEEIMSDEGEHEQSLVENDDFDSSSNVEEEEHTDQVVVDSSILNAQSRAAAEEKARARVRRQLEEQKKKNGRKGAFRSGNSNKTYVKGKRVMNDIGY
jgi:RIO kinase 2